jgi:endonuclease/exonuclease/phosphatase family metal-dependent hydrolase
MWKIRTASGAGSGRLTRVTTLTVATYNVRSLRDSEDASALLIRRFGADLAMLQEVPRFLRWRSRLAAFARRAELLYAAGGGTTGGSALLTHLRVDVLATYDVRLSHHPPLHQRGLAAAAVEIGGARLLVASTHMSLASPERATHARELLDHLHRLAHIHRAEHLVLAGDLNEEPGGRAWEILAAGGLNDAWAKAPHKRIDAVLVSEGIEVAWAGVPEEIGESVLAGASDHCPVVATLEVPED